MLLQQSPLLFFCVVTGGRPPPEHSSLHTKPLAESTDWEPVGSWFSSMLVQKKPASVRTAAIFTWPECWPVFIEPANVAWVCNMTNIHFYHIVGFVATVTAILTYTATASNYTSLERLSLFMSKILYPLCSLTCPSFWSDMYISTQNVLF